MLVGYIRVSSENDRQVFDLQYDALIKAGVDKRNIYIDSFVKWLVIKPTCVEIYHFKKPLILS